MSGNGKLDAHDSNIPSLLAWAPVYDIMNNRLSSTVLAEKQTVDWNSKHELDCQL